MTRSRGSSTTPKPPACSPPPPGAEPLDRLVVELLARTGLRASELCDLDADAVGRIGGAWWLRVPVGKLRNDRYIPLHPALVELLAAWPAGHQHLIEVDGRALDRHRVARIVRRVAKAAGLGHVHPHQLRHTLATQAINRGMRLEAIAALLGHRSLRMTLTYARIANRTVADEYAAAQARVDALYDHGDEPADLTPLRQEHRRMLGNGWCARPRGTDCTFEAICEGCGYYQTSVEFAPTLRAQRDHAASHGQTARVRALRRPPRPPRGQPMTHPDHRHIPFPLDTITGITAARRARRSAPPADRAERTRFGQSACVDVDAVDWQAISMTLQEIERVLAEAQDQGVETIAHLRADVTAANHRVGPRDAYK